MASDGGLIAACTGDSTNTADCVVTHGASRTIGLESAVAQPEAAADGTPGEATAVPLPAPSLPPSNAAAAAAPSTDAVRGRNDNEGRPAAGVPRTVTPPAGGSGGSGGAELSVLTISIDAKLRA